MAHVILLGDSIFDNARYVPGGPAVTEHLKRMLPDGSRATLLAVDGSETTTMGSQFSKIPSDASHLVLSVGGNDALGCSAVILHESAGSFREVLSRMEAIRSEFRTNYVSVLDRLLSLNLPLAVCTVYDAIPVLEPAELAGLCLFNDIILREAFRRGLTVIDLRLVCAEAQDYATTSPIEPSAAGGWKIAQAICHAVTGDASQPARSRVFV
jgi:hypothetical protein